MLFRRDPPVDIQHTLESAAGQLVQLVQQAISDAQSYDYLESSREIWERARRMLQNAQENDDLKGTASELNSAEFEDELVAKMADRGIIYKRAICFPSLDPDLTEDIFPPFQPELRMSKKSAAAEYSNWYSKFHKACENWLSSKSPLGGDIFALSVMSRWEQALHSLHPALNMKIVRHNSFLVADFLLLHSARDGHSEAIIAFPTRRFGSMSSGLYTRHQQFTNELSLNLNRLFFDT